ncbi:MAG: hypothetical protein KF855_11360 [Acidobacteria bacterium]|nr:hypothetical protein [Acidobacteriota bacterium]
MRIAECGSRNIFPDPAAADPDERNIGTDKAEMADELIRIPHSEFRII